jgi:hypothetical protein
LQKEGFQHLAKSYSYKYCEYYEEIPGNNLFMIFYLKSYNYCEYYEEIPGNNFFIIFYLKSRFLAETLRERKS